MSRRLWTPCLLVFMTLAPLAAWAQTRSNPATNPRRAGNAATSGQTSTPAQNPPSTAGDIQSPTGDTQGLQAAVPQTGAEAGPDASQPGTEPNGDSETTQTPQFVVTTPTPKPAPRTWRDNVAWGANIVLAVLGYIGIMLALRLFRSIRQQTEVSAATAQAALDAATAALAQSKAIVDAERPWVVVTVEPFLTMENSFKIIATNRGRTPARILSVVDRVKVAADETQLPEEPEYAETDPSAAPDPMVLLPGETAGVLAFSREDVKTICKTPEEQKDIELWKQSIFLYGRIIYKDMITPEETIHETSWCCRYIHGEKNSAMVIAGPPLYNQHS